MLAVHTIKSVAVVEFTTHVTPSAHKTRARKNTSSLQG